MSIKNIELGRQILPPTQAILFLDASSERTKAPFNLYKEEGKRENIREFLIITIFVAFESSPICQMSIHL